MSLSLLHSLPHVEKAIEEPTALQAETMQGVSLLCLSFKYVASPVVSCVKHVMPRIAMTL